MPEGLRIPLSPLRPAQWLLDNPHAAQWFCTGALFSTWLVHRINVPKNAPKFWEGQTVRQVVATIGIGGVVSLVDSIAEHISLGHRSEILVANLVAYGNHLTAALILPTTMVAFTRVVPSLQEDGSPAFHHIRVVLGTWPVSVCTIAGVLSGAISLVYACREGTYVRLGFTRWAWLYRVSMNLPAGLFTAVLAAALLHAHVVGRRLNNTDPHKRTTKSKLLPGLIPTRPSQEKTRMDSGGLLGKVLGRRKSKHPGQLRDPLAYRWPYMALTVVGLSLLELDSFLLPLGAWLSPHSLLAKRLNAFCRLVEIPTFMVIGLGAYLSFSRPTESPLLDSRWDRYDYYKKLIEKYDIIYLDVFSAYLRKLGIDLEDMEGHVDALLADSEHVGQTDRAEEANTALRLVLLCTMGSGLRYQDYDFSLVPIRADLLALERLRDEFAQYPPRTEPRTQAENDGVSRVANQVRLLTDPFTRPGLRSPDWVQTVAYVVSKHGLLSGLHLKSLTPRIERAERKLLR